MVSRYRRHTLGERFEVRIDDAVRHQRDACAFEVVGRRAERAGGCRNDARLLVERELARVLAMAAPHDEADRDDRTPVAVEAEPAWRVRAGDHLAPPQ